MVERERNRARVERTKGGGGMRYIINKAALSGGGWRQPTGRREPRMAKQVPVQDHNRYLPCGKSPISFSAKRLHVVFTRPRRFAYM